MKPDCFKQFNAHLLAPCARCALRGPCASFSPSPSDFRVLSRARYAKSVEVYRMDTAAFDPTVANVLHRLFEPIGLTRRSGKHDAWYFLGKTRVGHIMEARVGRVVFFLDNVPSRAVCAIDAYKNSNSEVLDNRVEFPGSILVAPSPQVAADIISSVASMLRIS